MKIKVIEKKYSEILEYYKNNPIKHKKPKRPNILFRTLLKLVSIPDLLATHFTCEKIGMEKLGKKEPALFLMNHSSFIDLEIVASVLYPRPFNIVATTDGFIGKSWLMRQIGCIPTKKFVSDPALVRDMLHTTRKLNDSVIMYPEAGYSFDGTATTMPDSLGKLIKMLDVPVVFITTYGAFSRDPLYNNLQRRKVKVSAKMEYTLSPEQIRDMNADEINEIVNEHFSFDSFRWQKENHVKIDESFRADGLNRILYKCPECDSENHTNGKGEYITCNSCGQRYFLDEYGELHADRGTCKISHIPDWYHWERECVKKELNDGSYHFECDVDIMVSLDTTKLWHVGEGKLIHTPAGFTLTGCDGELHYEQKPLSTYSVNSDFNWYEIGDMISIGDNHILYYCFPKDQSVSVAKVRIAAEEIYKLERAKLQAAKI